MKNMKNFELMEYQLINGDLVIFSVAIAHSTLIDHPNLINNTREVFMYAHLG